MLPVGLLALAASLAAYWFSRNWWEPPRLSPDGRRYIALSIERRGPRPFVLRWLLPAMCGSSFRSWRLCTTIHLILLAPVLALWLNHWEDSVLICALGGVLVAGLPGIWQIHLRMPVLVDVPAMTWALVSATLALNGYTLPAIAVAALCGAIKESAPVFAAVYAANPVLLLGLVAPLVRAVSARTAADPENEDDILRHPLRTGWESHRTRWHDPRLMLAPWGLCLLAPLVADTNLLRLLGISLLLAYAQLLAAFDTVRLYQWAAPPMILCTVTFLPTWFLVAALPFHLRNPWSGPGY